MSKIRIGINGLGRIGRCVMRALMEEAYDDEIEIAAVNGPAPTDTHLHLLRYDSVHGVFREPLSAEDDHMTLGDQSFPVFHERDPLKLDWSAVGADIVLECTGHFTTHAGASQHIERGARKVLISAPAKDDVPTVVYGVNHQNLRENDNVISIGSCTTNCLAPLAKVLHDEFGIAHGFMTTIHAYTGDQNLVDGSHKDLRRARAAGLSMVPTSTGAASALGLVLPELAGRLHGTAIRVPTPNVSLVDLSFGSTQPLRKDLVHDALEQAANSSLKGVLALSDAPLVSTDFTHHPASSIVDLTGTHIIDDHFARVVSWYDNEWGFSCRMLDMVKAVA